MFNDVTAPAVETVAVNEPVGFELNLSEHDAQLFSMYQTNFRKWGIHGTIRSLKTDEGRIRQVVFIKRMPKIVGDKFDTAPGIILDLVKTHLMLLEETNGMAATCPVGIRRLLDGRACRGEILFLNSSFHHSTIQLRLILSFVFPSLRRNQIWRSLVNGRVQTSGDVSVQMRFPVPVCPWQALHDSPAPTGVLEEGQNNPLQQGLKYFLRNYVKQQTCIGMNKQHKLMTKGKVKGGLRQGMRRSLSCTS